MDRHEQIVAFRKFSNEPEKRLLGRPGVRRRLALKYTVKKQVGKVWIEYIWLFLRAVSSSWLSPGIVTTLAGTKWRWFWRLSLQVKPFVLFVTTVSRCELKIHASYLL